MSVSPWPLSTVNDLIFWASFHLQQACMQNKICPRIHCSGVGNEPKWLSSACTWVRSKGRFCASGSFVRYMSLATPLHLPDTTALTSISRNLIVESKKKIASTICWADVAPEPESRMKHNAVYSCSSVILMKFKKPSCLKIFASLHSELDLFCRVDEALALKQSLMDISTIGDVQPAPSIELMLLPSWLAMGSCRIKSRNLHNAIRRISSSGNSFLTRFTFKRMTGGSRWSVATEVKDRCTVVEFSTSEIPMPEGKNMSLNPARMVPLQPSPVLNTVLITGSSQGSFSLVSLCLLLWADIALCFHADSPPQGSSTSMQGALSGKSKGSFCSPTVSSSQWGAVIGIRSQPDSESCPQLEGAPSKWSSSYTCSALPAERSSATEEVAHLLRKPFSGRGSSNPVSISSSMNQCQANHQSKIQRVNAQPKMKPQNKWNPANDLDARLSSSNAVIKASPFWTGTSRNFMAWYVPPILFVSEVVPKSVSSPISMTLFLKAASESSSDMAQKLSKFLKWK